VAAFFSRHQFWDTTATGPKALRHLSSDKSAVREGQAMSDRNCPFSNLQLKKPADRVSWSDELAAFAVSQHADVARILSDCRFSANLANIDQQSGQLPIEKDVSAAVPKVIHLIRDRLDWIRRQIEQTVQAVCQKWYHRSSFDLQQDLIVPCCQDLALSLTGCETGGSEAENLLELANTVFLTVHTDRARADMATAELVQHFQEIMTRRRRSPRDDLVSVLVAIDQPTCVLSPLIQMFVGLATSLPLFLGNASLALLLNPEQKNCYLQSPTASVGELLRYAGPAQVVYRLALQDALVGDHHFQRGDRLGLLLAHANRDEQVFTEPEKLDFSRKSVPHLSFGKGMHACLGAPIIQAAGAILPYNILSRFPQMQIDIANTNWGGSQTIQGIIALPIWNTETTGTPRCRIRER